MNLSPQKKQIVRNLASYFASYFASASAMSFVNKSVNYSQIELLKTKVLKNILINYTKTISNIISSKLSQQSFIVPNNNKKYYLLITHNSKINKTDNYNILYFFPDKLTTEQFKNNKLEANKICDFFIETDYIFPFECLVEGYLYEGDKSSNISNNCFLISDILTLKKNTEDHAVIQSDYQVRYSVINDLFLNFIPKMTGINNHLSISIHPVFESVYTKNNSLIKVFMKNFVFSSQLNCLETICLFQKTKKLIDKSCSVENKIIIKTELADVYKVKNIKTNNDEGILYVKTIAISKHLKNLFASGNSQQTSMPCQFNCHFNKWQPII